MVYASPTGLSSHEIDRLVASTMEKYHVPGIAIGIIKNGKIIHAKGYGVKNINKKDKVNTETLFGIASTGKSFTAVGLALLVDEGKIKWNDKVIDHISNFRLFDPWVTREFTILDLLIHNSGLGLGAGDLMFWLQSSFTREEIISNLRYLKPVSSFRSEYAYDNLLYIVAGELIAKVSGISYEEFIDSRIIEPLAMKNCTANMKSTKDFSNIADPHMYRDGMLHSVIRDVKVGEVFIAAAGGIQCSVKSILKWHAMHLSQGRLPNGKTFLSEKQQAFIMTPHNILPVKPNSKKWFNTNFSTYGLGWKLSDKYGYKVIEHGGTLLGMMSMNSMVPDLGLGIVVYTNQQSRIARQAIMSSILEAYLTESKTDWGVRLDKVAQDKINKSKEIIASNKIINFTPTGNLSRYAGTFKDSWFGDVEISENNGVLYFRSVRSERLKGEMVAYQHDQFIVRWDDRSLEADAYIKYLSNYNGEPTHFIMKAISPLTDFSFDFQDLNLKRISK
ncbi:MAG: serine hydrolase [Pseudomonadota bacterium]